MYGKTGSLYLPKKGGIHTARGEKIPRKPSVSQDVVKWTKVINRWRKNYTPEQVMELFDFLNTISTWGRRPTSEIDTKLKELVKCDGLDSTLKQPDSTPVKTES